MYSPTPPAMRSIVAGGSKMASRLKPIRKELKVKKMKKTLVFLLLAVFALSAATPAFAYHHRRHHRYHGGQPVVVVRF